MSRSVPHEQVVAAFRDACYQELQALKPGNVHVHAGGHKLSVQDFEKSADAAAHEIAVHNLSVGDRILNSVRATRDAVGTNTNLGIILLCAPIVQAALANGAGDLRDKLKAVLEDLTVQDAVDAYEAIRLAQPGGMGASDEHDLADIPTITLLEAMQASADRDQIALQYANGFEQVFDYGLGRYEAGLSLFGEKRWATTHLFLGFLSSWQDTLILRKFGKRAAEDVSQMAASVEKGFSQAVGDRDSFRSELLAFDAELKGKGLNPGTSADLTVATIFAYELESVLYDDV